LLTYGGGYGWWRAGDGRTARPKLVDGEGGLQWFSDVDDGTYVCGGVPWCSMLAWLRARRLVAMRQQRGTVARVSAMKS
jgi:hypothetical protein